MDAAAIEARKLMLSWTARSCCWSIFVVELVCLGGKWNIDKDSLENNLFVDCCCCWVSWINASSIDDDVDDDADDDDWRLVDDALPVDGFVDAKSSRKKRNDDWSILIYLFDH